MEEKICHSITQKKSKKIILINQLYTGTYLEEGYNVGHEVINMIPTKDNEHYLYITPKGTIKDKKKADKIESVIFVQRISKGEVYEIVGIATELTHTNKECEDGRHKDDENIKYGNNSINASLKDIFRKIHTKANRIPLKLTLHLKLKMQGHLRYQ